mmetsp:Transcript_21336/g.47192  ORF Transcript_21336/g.47192 Transcript_21336/m.47192 type:complete len:219 (+) Transcript_21336:1235-1891(+)
MNLCTEVAALLRALLRCRGLAIHLREAAARTDVRSPGCPAAVVSLRSCPQISFTEAPDETVFAVPSCPPGVVSEACEVVIDLGASHEALVIADASCLPRQCLIPGQVSDADEVLTAIELLAHAAVWSIVHLEAQSRTRIEAFGGCLTLAVIVTLHVAEVLPLNVVAAAVVVHHLPYVVLAPARCNSGQVRPSYTHVQLLQFLIQAGPEVYHRLGLQHS